MMRRAIRQVKSLAIIYVNVIRQGGFVGLEGAAAFIAAHRLKAEPVPWPLKTS
jgi:hypothetical protein